MGGMWLSGLGAGISQAGSMLASYGQDQMYEKRLAAAEKAREARAKADAERQAFLEATTPVSPRKTFLGDASEGPPHLQYGKFNKFGDMVESGSANEYEKAQYREGMLSESKRAEADRAKAEAAKARWQRTEEGKDRRASISANRPRGEVQGPAPRLFKALDGTPIWVKPGESPPKGSVPWTDAKRDSGNPNDWLSQF